MAYAGANTVHRALSLLKVFTDERPTWTLTQLASHAGVSKATAHRLLAALEGEGFLTRSPRGAGFRLGPELIVLGSRALRSINLRELAHPEMESLARTTGEDATLEVLMGQEVLIIDEVRGASLFGMANSIGTRWPPHATATGKVLLAFSAPSPPVTTGAFHRFTHKTLASWEELSRTLEGTRNQGFATNIEELEPGYVAVAAPIRDQGGNAVAAISLGGPIHRIGKEKIPELAALLCAAGARISRMLGHAGVV